MDVSFLFLKKKKKKKDEIHSGIANGSVLIEAIALYTQKIQKLFFCIYILTG